MEGPYRASRPLTDVIQPDRRREHAVVFGGACMVAGALLFKGIGMLLEPRPAPPPMVGFGDSPPDLSTPPTQAFLAAYTPQPARVQAPDLGSDDVTSVVATHRALVKDRCWRARPPTAPAGAPTRVSVDLVIAPSGNVLSSTGSGTDTEVANCVATQAMAWHFPPRAANGNADLRGDTHLSLPFLFVRD